MSLNIYLDESGDMGWQLDKPYPDNGSSRYLVIVACLVSDQDDHLPQRLVRQLYKHFKWQPNREKKWTNMCPKAHIFFVDSTAIFLRKYPSIKVQAIVVEKRKVAVHIRQDPNKLYNCCFLRRWLKIHGFTFFQMADP